MNAEKLQKLQNSVRTGGKGSVRRKKKVVRSAATGNDTKLQATLKRLALNPLQAIDEVLMYRDDGKVLAFANPKVQVNIQARTYVVTGKSEVKDAKDVAPGDMASLQKLMEQLRAGGAGAGADDVPNLVGDFESAAQGDDEPPALVAEK